MKNIVHTVITFSTSPFNLKLNGALAAPHLAALPRIAGLFFAALLILMSFISPYINYAHAADFTNAPISWPKPNAEVSALALGADGTLYIGGAFTSIDGTARNHLAAITSTGALSNWNPNVNGAVYSLAISGSTIYAVGDFTSVGGVTRNRVAAFNLDGSGALSNWNPNANDTVSAIAVSGTTVYLGGDFTTLGSQNRNFAAAVAVDTGSVLSWNPSANDSVFALAIDGSTIYLGGNFTTIGTTTRNRLAAVDASGTLGSWNPNANSFVAVLQVVGGVVYAGGDFITIGSAQRHHVAAIDSTGTPNQWSPDVNDLVAALQVSGSTVYMGGDFTSISGTARNHAGAVTTPAARSTSGTIAPTVASWNPNADDSVSSILAGSSKLYIGGLFTHLGGQVPGYFAAFSVAGDTTPPPSSGQVATPVFTPNGGTFSDLTAVVITDATSGATIHYTIDGSDPIETSTTYQFSVFISATTTVKARAFKAGLTASAVATTVFTKSGGDHCDISGGNFDCGNIILPVGTSAGDIVKFTGNPTIYLVQSDGLHAFDTYASFLGYVAAFRKSIINVDDVADSYTMGTGFAREVVDIPPAPINQYPTDTLVNQNGTIYLINGGNAVPFTNFTAFIGLGYKLKYVIKGSVAGYVVSQKYRIERANQVHPWGSWLRVDATHYYYAHETGLIRSPSPATFWNNAGQAKFVLPANQADLDILDQYPDLTALVSHDSRVY